MMNNEEASEDEDDPTEVRFQEGARTQRLLKLGKFHSDFVPQITCPYQL